MTLTEATQRVDASHAEMEVGPLALLGRLSELDRLYHEFPELYVTRPPIEWIAPLLRAVLRECAPAPIAALLRDAGEAADPSTGGLVRYLARSTDIQQALVRRLKASSCTDKQADAYQMVDAALRLFALLDALPAQLDPVLCALLVRDAAPNAAPPAIRAIVQEARSRLLPSSGQPHATAEVEALMRKAERLKTLIPPQPRKSHPDLAWPSGRMTFNEFLIQWPCEIELPLELDDLSFIEQLCQAAWLRSPTASEREQYVRLLRRGEVSRSWIAEDVLSSAEARSLQRRARVVIGTKVITDPEDPAASQIPAVEWPQPGEAQESSCVHPAGRDDKARR